jgi:hypothetical protein
MEFGLVIGFIAVLQLITTINYSDIAIHTQARTHARTHTCARSVIHCGMD